MRWTCPKCGKKLEISNKQLIDRDGLIVCPQCLLQARQPLPKSSSADEPPAYEAKQGPTPPERKRTATPPPYKSRMKSSITSSSNSATSNVSVAPRKTVGKKKSRKKGKNDGMSAWGCLARTVIITLLLFAAYVFFGLLLDALQ